MRTLRCGRPLIRSATRRILLHDVLYIRNFLRRMLFGDGSRMRHILFLLYAWRSCCWPNGVHSRQRHHGDGWSSCWSSPV
jgi:hypothetical protein